MCIFDFFLITAELEGTREFLNKSQSSLSTYKRKVKTLNQSKRRLQKRVADLTTILSELRNQNLMDEEHCSFLKGISKTSFCLFKRQKDKANGILERCYDERLKAFAVTLHFLSAKAYNFVRDTFDTCLPHPKYLSSWYQQIDGKPGISKEALGVLKEKAKEKKYVCALIIDSMAIKKHVEWDGHAFHGHVNVGTENDEDSAPIASQALVFHLVCINSSWKIPVAYFLIDSCSSQQQSTLIKHCLISLEEVGIDVVSVTCDGTATNIATLNLLGCELNDVANLKTYFSHPTTEQPVFAFLDPCHMLKLVRNALGDKKELVMENSSVQWKYVEELLAVQEKEGLRLGNKLTRSHVQYHKQKMKVKLAAQVLSTSVADALQLCLNEKIPEFEGCEATITFIRTFNDLFDILNSRSIKHKYLKQAMNPSNFDIMRRKLEEAKKYILQLREKAGTPIYMSARKTGFKGFLICIESALKMYNHLVVNDTTSVLKYLPLYKVSQDHLERLFGYIRSRNGHNNNPSARQFAATFKRILVHRQLSECSNGNAVPLDKIKILHVGRIGQAPEKLINKSMTTSRLITELEDDDNIEEFDYNIIPDEKSFASITTNIVEYIAGFITRRLSLEIHCPDCMQALTGSTKTGFSLINIKNRGGLVTPSEDVIRICRICEKLVRETSVLNPQKNLSDTLKIRLLNQCVTKNLFQNIESHFELYENHNLWLIESIGKKYFNVRLHYYSKEFNDKIHFRRIRQHLTKSVHFRGE